jgi:MFS family permease
VRANPQSFLSVMARLKADMKRYKELLGMPHVLVLAISAFPARLAYSMIALGIFFKTQQTTGSVAAAGFAIGLNSLAGSLSAGIRGSVMDRWGQKWPLRILVPSYATLILTLNTMQTKQSLLITAFLFRSNCSPNQFIRKTFMERHRSGKFSAHSVRT